MSIRTSRAASPAPSAIVRNDHAGALGRIPVSQVSPVVEHGAYPAKAVVGEEFPIRAHVFREGHDAVAASVVLTSPDGSSRRVDMTQVEPRGLDIFEVWVRPDAEGDWSFRIEGWSDLWHTWLHHAEAKLPLDMDVALLCTEAKQLLERAAGQAAEAQDATSATVLRSVAATMLVGRPSEELLESVRSTSVTRAMTLYAPREMVSPTTEFPLKVERRRALFSSWYEFFPRSQGAHRDSETGRWVSGTFTQSYERLEAAAAMGFDIVYVPPVHPIGTAYRKGGNNTLTPSEDDPGSPWAIGGAEGGHDAIHPELGTMDDFEAFVAKARELGLEVAMDFALQASPDHPWVSDHPEWFTTRADGTIAYAENPPKKYQDIYPVNFDNDPEGIYAESRRLLELWISKGVTVFRVDNPHTKPIDFWDWMLGEIHAAHSEVIFLAEAFTRPQMMHALGKVGYQQSYTYFTWRTSKTEIQEYLEQLSDQSAAFYRPNFWVNTPDINPFHLQSGNPAAFATRAVLAATLVPSWGVYSGFELCEHLPVAPGREEYLDSEKYEFRPRDFNGQPNLSILLGRLNEVRRANPALQQLRRIHFHHTSSDDLIAYSKRDGDNVVLVVCSLAPDREVLGEVHLDLEVLGAGPGDVINVTDQLTSTSYHWGGSNFVRLTLSNPAHVFVVRPL